MDTEKKSFLQEFKEFAVRGNVIDLAVGVVIGSAFTAIVNALVQNIIMPIVGILTGGVNFASWAFPPGSAEDGGIAYGLFIQAVVSFFIIAFVVFLMVKLINSTVRKPKEEAPKGPTETDLLAEIRDLLAQQQESQK